MGLSGNSDFVNGNQFTKNKRNIDSVVNEYNDKVSCACNYINMSYFEHVCNLLAKKIKKYWKERYLKVGVGEWMCACVKSNEMFR